MPRSHCQQRAFSLFEVVAATLLVGVLMLASLETVGGASQNWLAASQTQRVEMLAHQLMAEVLAQPYSDPDTTNDPDRRDFGPEAGETTTSSRIDFDDVDDYDDWTASPPQSRDGTVLSGYSGWSRSVVVQKLRRKRIDAFESDGAVDQGMRLVTVTVTSDGARTFSLSALRGWDGAVEQSLGVTSDLVDQTSIRLAAGGSDTVYAETPLTNHAEVP